MAANSDGAFVTASNQLSTENTLIRLRSLMRSLTKSEQLVAEIVLSQTDKVIYFSVTDLSEQAGVGDTTVLRFCRKIGFKGYQEFKLALAKELVNPVKSLHSELSDEDDPILIARKVSEANQQAIEDTMTLLDPEQIEMAVSAISTADKVHFYGVGTSGLTAQVAKYKFLRIGVNVDAYNDPHMQAVAATGLGKKSVVVGLSVSGSTKDTINSVRIAKEAGATVISVTHHARSPITKISDIVLLTAGKEAPLQSGSLASMIAQLHAIDIMCTAVGMKNKNKALEHIEKTATSVMDKMY